MKYAEIPTYKPLGYSIHDLNKVLDNIKNNGVMNMDDFHYLLSKGVKMHEMFKREDVIAGKITEKIYTDTLIAKADDMHRKIKDLQ